MTLILIVYWRKKNMCNSNENREMRLAAMQVKILRLEFENLKTRAKTNDQMVETIRTIISNEARKNYYNQ